MLKKTSSTKLSAKGHRFAIVASKYNRKYVDGMLRAAKAELTAAGAAYVKTIRVPGAFEIPAAAAALAELDYPDYSVVICLGIILQGETTHADHIGQAVSHALAHIQIRARKPVVHEVLQFTSEEQARVRCLDTNHNRGNEAAQTAIEMANVMKKLK